MTKLMRDAYRRYRDSELYSIYDAYQRPSKAKRDAWKHCLDLMMCYNGEGLRVIGHNTSFFSAGFVFTDKDGRDRFAFITKGGMRSEFI